MAQLGIACKATSRACAKAGIAGLFGIAGGSSRQISSSRELGDDQTKLDVLTSSIFVNALTNSGACSMLLSKLHAEPIVVPQEKQGRFFVAFDSLNGTGNIDCSVGTGSIFAVYEKVTPGEPPLRTGKDLLAAG